MISDSTKAELGRAEMSAIIELFELDISKINDKGGQNVWLFSNEVNEFNQPIVWRGQKFMPMPIKLDGMELKSSGPSNRPTLTVGNVDGYMTGVIVQYNGLMGAKLTRYRVEARFLDAENFKNGNPTANPNEYVADSYLFNKAGEYNKFQVVFELALPSETDGATLPNRTILATVCPFQYRGIGCGYDGHAVADIDDYAIGPHETDKDQCSKRLSGCQARFGVNAQLPFGGFVMADKVGQ